MSLVELLDSAVTLHILENGKEVDRIETFQELLSAQGCPCYGNLTLMRVASSDDGFLPGSEAYSSAKDGVYFLPLEGHSHWWLEFHRPRKFLLHLCILLLSASIMGCYIRCVFIVLLHRMASVFPGTCWNQVSLGVGDRHWFIKLFLPRPGA